MEGSARRRHERARGNGSWLPALAALLTFSALAWAAIGVAVHELIAWI